MHQLIGSSTVKIAGKYEHCCPSGSLTREKHALKAIKCSSKFRPGMLIWLIVGPVPPAFMRLARQCSTSPFPSNPPPFFRSYTFFRIKSTLMLSHARRDQNRCQTVITSLDSFSHGSSRTWVQPPFSPRTTCSEPTPRGRRFAFRQGTPKRPRTRKGTPSTDKRNQPRQ